MRSLSVVRCIGASLLVLSCGAPLDAPSAYTSERFLCAPEHTAEWNALVSACNERSGRDRSCPGVASFRGETDGEAFVTDEPLVDASYEYDATTPTSVVNLRLNGRSPYFGLNLSVDRVTVETTPGSPSRCVAGSSALFGLEVRGSSTVRRVNFRTCEFTSSPSGVDVAFSGTFVVGGGSLDACIHFPPEAPSSVE
jgi:hypothetical protein